MSDYSRHQRPWRNLVMVMAAAGIFGLTGCTEENSTSPQDAWHNPDDWHDDGEFIFSGNSPAEIAQESKASYDDNENGLITGTTLDDWIDDWANNKPDGIDGDLVILQVSTSYTDDNDNTAYIYIDGDTDNDGAANSGVRVYAIDTERLKETRSNGVIETRSMVPSGSKMDDFLADYDIDPTEDMVVWAMGVGGKGENMAMGRGWYMMRYWGVPAKNLALLNGGANHSDVMVNVEVDLNKDNTLDDAQACDENVDSSCLPGGGTVSVADLPEDNFSLQATQQDVMAVVRGDVDAFIWDARTEAEYMHDDDAFKNSGAKQGHPNGAVVLSYANLLVDDDQATNNYDAAGDISPGASYQYKSKTALQTYMDGDAQDGARFKRNYSGELGNLQSSDVYEDGQVSITYCETTYRAMITGVASAVILGMPNRFYDGAMVEWNSMANIQDQNGKDLLPKHSPWRTDSTEYSYYEYNTSANIEPRTIDDAYATNTNAIPDADYGYKNGDTGSGDTGSDDSGDDDGGGGVPNPCGG